MQVNGIRQERDTVESFKLVARAIDVRQASREQVDDCGSERITESSPSRLFSSSPRTHNAMSVIPSSPSSAVSAGETADDGVGSNARNKRLLISDDEADSASEDDDAAFLANFRACQAQKSMQVNPSDHPASSGSVPSAVQSSQAVDKRIPSVFSGSLSEPPSMHSNGLSTSYASSQVTSEAAPDSSEGEGPASPSPKKRFMRKSMLPATSFDSDTAGATQSTPVTYQSELQKHNEAAAKKLNRARKLKEMAARNRASNAGPESSQPNLAEDEISSASDAETKKLNMSLHQAGKSKPLGKKGVLQLDRIGESDSDLSDLEVGVLQPHNKVPLKQLSKKEMDEMVRMQARIEREKRTSAVRNTHVPRKVGTFSINDLIANIGASEAVRRPSKERHDSPSSDPIQTSSSEPEANDNGVQRDPSIVPPAKEERPFYIRIRERSNDASLTASATADGKDTIAKERLRLLREAKRLAMADSTELPDPVRATSVDEDDGIELVESAPPVKDAEDEEDDVTVSATQIQRAGRLFKAMNDEAQAKKESEIAAVPQRKAPEKLRDSGKGISGRDLDALIFKRIEQQNLELRRKREEMFGKREQSHQRDTDTGAADINSMLQQLGEGAKNEQLSDDDGDEGDDSEFEPEAGSEIGSDTEEASHLGVEGTHSDDEMEVGDSPLQVSTKKSHRQRVLPDDEEEAERESSHVSIAQDDADVVVPHTVDAFGGTDFAEFFAATPEPDAGDDTTQEASALGQFFQDTQSDTPLRGESFTVLPVRTSDLATGLMPPPTTGAKGLSLLQGSENDGFAALRRAQANEAMFLNDEPDDLPALEDILRPDEERELIALEMEAMRADAEQRQARQMREAAANNVTYINKDGFFTQTRPDSFTYSFTQSQSQNGLSSAADSMDEGTQDDEEGLAIRSAGALAARKRRYRRIASASSDGEGSAGQENTERIAAEVGDTVTATDLDRQPRSAFDIMRSAASEMRSRVDAEQDRAVRRYVQGEAEESDDESEDGAGLRKTGKHGGLGGVFSDDERGSADEEDEDEDDGADLEDLIDEQRELDEAEKDVLARERYQQDMDEDEKAALALHERATKGAFRTKRRARNNQDGALEGFLDEDYEDDWLEKVARNPYGSIAKKRRLQGKDGMDLLAEKEESQAFVREYRESHQDSVDVTESYSFLLQAEEEDEEEQPVLIDDDVRTSRASRVDAAQESGDESEEEDGGRIHSEPSTTITRQQIREVVAARRKLRRQRANMRTLDDEADAEEDSKRLDEERRREEELKRNIERALYDPDEDELEFSASVVVSDRIERRAGLSRKAEGSDGRGYDDEDDEDDGDEAAGFGILNLRRINTTEREKERMARLAQDYASEPDWRSAKEAIARTRHAAVKTASAARAVHPSTRTQPPSRQSSSSSSSVQSRLRGVLSRQGQFSESQ